MNRLPLVFALALCGAALAACDDDCDALIEEADALVDDAEACGAGDSCTIVDMYELAGPNTCLQAFQCSRAVKADTDLEAFRSRARRIAADYDGCPQCVLASCVDPRTQVATCDAAQGRCVLEERP